MNKPTFSWLHLSDFHFGLKGQKFLWPTLRAPFLEDLAEMHEVTGPWDAVLFTGDLVQSGESAQFKQMQQEVLDPIWEKLKQLGSGDAFLLAVPGNHDLYRPDPREDNAAIDTLLNPEAFDRISGKFWDHPSGAYRGVIRNAFAGYDEWWIGAPHRPSGVSVGMLPGDFSFTFKCADRSVGFVGLNTTFLQLGNGNYEKQLVWDPRQVHAVCGGSVDQWFRDHDIAFLLTHHGPDWLTEAARQTGDIEIAPAGRFALHLFGHQHEPKITYTRHAGSSRTVRRYQAASAFGMEFFGNPPVLSRNHGYSIGRIEFRVQGAAMRFWPRIATPGSGRWRYVPDHGHVELDRKDSGTVNEVIPLLGRRRSTLPSASFPIGHRLDRKTGRESMRTFTMLPARRPFFGREKDLERIAKCLSPEDRSWGVVLDGPGGIGKSALALEAATRAPVEHFPLKIWITAKDRELTPSGEQTLPDFRVSNYDEMLRELGRALDHEEIANAAAKELPSLVRRFLSQQRALLILDNLESFSAEERRRVFELLSVLPNTCRAIVTSRRRTDGTSAAYNLRLDRLERAAAGELLSELGKKSVAIAQLTDAEREQLYVESGGNPLILSWTAGQLGRTVGRSRTVAEAIERLKEAQRLHRLDPKNDPLDFVFGDIVDTLTPAEVEVLAALVPFTEPAKVTWLLPLTTLSEMTAEDALDGLRDRALLVEDDVAGTWLLPPLAATFLRRVRPDSVLASVHRLADQIYALALANHSTNMAAIEDAWPNVIAGLASMAKTNSRQLQPVCEVLRDFVDNYGHWVDALPFYEAAATQAAASADYVEAAHRVLEVCGFYMRLGRFDEVLAGADRADWYLDQASSTDVSERNYVMSVRAYGFYHTGRFMEATEAFTRVINEARLSPLEGKRVRIHLTWLGASLLRTDNLEKAEEVFLEVKALATASADYEELARVNCQFIELALARSQWSTAEQLAKQVLTFMTENNISSRELQASCLDRMGQALMEQGKRDEALPYLEEAVELFEGLGSPKLSRAIAHLESCRNRPA